MRIRVLLLSLACALSGALLGACASAPPAAPRVAADVEALFADARFAPPSEGIDAADVFALSDEMRRYLREEAPAALRRHGPQHGLVEALYKRGQLRLEYDAERTRTASEAFEARAGNCLSLVVMTAAFARELGVPVTFRSAVVEETWTRSRDLFLRSGHVNVTLGQPLRDRLNARHIDELTVDFVPASDLHGLQTVVIDEPTIVAMFMNNRAAEALVQGRVDDAYWWAREAIRQAPSFAGAFNTLGVVHLRRGDLARAERAFAHVLRQEPRNTRAMANLVQTLERDGRGAGPDAALLRETLARLEPHPPFHFYDLGRAAMERGDYAAAREHFRREVRRVAYSAEFHFWLALAHYRLGELDDARRELARAAEYGGTRGERERYAGKLEWLRALGGAAPTTVH